MYFRAAFAVFLLCLILLWGGSMTATLAAAKSQPLVATSPLLPSYPSGDLKLFHYPGNVPGNVAFTPDGSAYSPIRDGLLRIAPDGTKSFVGTPSTYGGGSINQRIVYSNGFLWLEVHQGILRMHPDGTDRRYFQPSGPNDERGFDNLTAGPNGIYYTFYNQTGTLPNGYPILEPVLAYLSNSFVKTITPLAPPAPDEYNDYLGASVTTITYAPDGNVYFEYRKTPGKPFSLGRVTSAGVVTLFGHPDICGSAETLVYSNRLLYFINYSEGSGPTSASNTLCSVATYSGEYTRLLTKPPVAATNIDVVLVADSDGDLWITNFFGVGLYSYMPATGVASGPVDPSVVNIAIYFRHPNLYIGPDQNIYFFGTFAANQLYFGAYIRHRMSFIPSAVGLVYSDSTMDFYVSEPIKSGPWTAVSLNPAIATVTPSSSPVGRFTVTEVGHGSTSIKVTDVYGNVQYLPVTSN